MYKRVYNNPLSNSINFFQINLTNLIFDNNLPISRYGKSSAINLYREKSRSLNALDVSAIDSTNLKDARNVFWQDPSSKRDRFGQIRDIFRKSWRSHHASWIIELFCVIKWPFYDPPLAYLIRTDYTITAVNSIPSCGLLVASKFWRVVTKKKEEKRKRKKCSVTGKEWRGEKGGSYRVFERKVWNVCPVEGICRPCSVYVGSRIIGAPFNRLSVPHLSECLEKRVYVCDRDGGDGCSKVRVLRFRFFIVENARDLFWTDSYYVILDSVYYQYFKRCRRRWVLLNLFSHLHNFVN